MRDVREDIWTEVAQELFEENYELDMFFRLKKLGTVAEGTRKKCLRELKEAGILGEFAEKFLEAQFIDMQDQIAEQRSCPYSR